MTAVSNTIVSFLPVFALTDQEGKLFKPLAYTKTFAITASAILAITVVPVLAYYLLKSSRIGRRKSLLLATALGLLSFVASGAVFRTFFLPDPSPLLQGWLIAAAIGLMVALAVYRMTRERLLPLEQNIVSRGIFRVYEPMLRWVLAHKGTFLLLPITIVLLGLTIWLGWETVAYPVQAGLSRAGVDVERYAWWRGAAEALPGLGREFMPPLDEGSLLYMPSLVPAASLSAATEVIARQDMAIRSVPEVESVVGKLGRAESALDPAPIGMIETIIMLKPTDTWRMVKAERFYSNWPGWAQSVPRYFLPEERRITKDEILKELRKKTDIPGVLPTWLQPIQTRIVMLQSGFRAMMGIKIFGSDLREIEKLV